MADSASISTLSRAPSPDIPQTARPQQPFRFQWDNASRKGPASVYSETTDARADIPPLPVRPELNTNLSTFAAGALPSEWSSSRHGFHAISTVLNNPHRKQAPPKAHSTIPPVQPAELPRIKRRDFDGYINAVRPEWDRFQSALKHEPAPALTSPTQEDDPFARPWNNVSSGSKHIAPLDSVPRIYFDESFNLGDPRTFAAVAELGPDSGAGHPHRDLASISHALPLLEKLSHYGDVVESHLVREIGLRSSSFFAALNNLNDLQSESAECLNRIAKLRDMLREVDERTAKRGLEIVRMEKKLRNLGEVQDGVATVRHVTEMVGAANTLVGAGEYGEALDVIEELERLLAQPPEPPRQPPPLQLTLPRSSLSIVPESPLPPPPRPAIHLGSLSALSELPTQLRELSLQIATSLTFDLSAILKADLEHRMGGPVDEAVPRDRLRPVMQGLLRTHGLSEALGQFGQVVSAEVNETVSRVLGADEETLRDMPHEQFIDVARHLFAGLLRHLDAVQNQQVAIQGVAQMLGAGPAVLEPLQNQMQELLSGAAELANMRCGKLLALRGETHAGLPLVDFVALHDAAWAFVLKSEVVNRRMIVGLRGVVLGQSKSFLQRFHADRLTRSAKLVEEETWAQVEVAAAAQKTADLLIRAAMSDPPDLLSPPTLNGAPSSPTNGVAAPKGAKVLTISEGDMPTSFFAVGATLAVLDLTADYLRLVLRLGSLASEAMGKVIEFLKAFNSRTCQVVLGAGAMRSAGLKNITAKHLALASQSLAIMIALIPYIRETFRRHLSPKQAVMLIEFDKLKRDFQEHQYEIHEKLVAIMKDRLLVHCKSLLEVQWEMAATEPGPNSYMRLLVKETETLYKVLSKYLNAGVLQLIMTQVLASIKDQLSEEFGSIDVQSQAAKDRMLTDVRFLQERLGGLPNVGSGLGSTVETVVQERMVPRKSLRDRMSGATAASMVADEAGAVSGAGRLNGNGNEQSVEI